MKATVSAASLKQAVSWVSKIVHKSPLPMLDCVMVSADYDSIQVKATNVDITLTRNIKATVTEASPICVNAKSLKDCLGKTRGNTTLSLQSYVEPGHKLPMLGIEGSAILMTLAAANPDDFPLGLQDVEWDNAISLDPIATSLSQIAKFADHEQDNNRVVLKCVLVEVYNEGQYRLTTADGFRLVTTNAIQGEKVAEYLLPAKAAEMIASLKTKGVLALGTDYAQFTTDNSTVTTKLDDGKFPDYNQIIPASDRGTWAIFDTEEIASTLAPFKAMTSRGSNYHYSRPTNFSLSGGRLVLSATSEDGNQIESSIAVDWTGEDLAIGLDAGYVLDCLALCGDKAEIMFENPSRPITVKGNGCQMVVMPMHIKG